MTSKIVKCPQCGNLTEYRTDNPARPFCSERCKLIDLGAWAEERYSIAGQPFMEGPRGLSPEDLGADEFSQAEHGHTVSPRSRNPRLDS